MLPIVTAFKTHLLNLGYGEKSAPRYAVQVASFFEYHGIGDVKAATPAQVQSFYEWLHIRPNQVRGGGLSAASIGHHMGSLNLFFEWLERSGEISSNPMSALRFKPGPRGKREPLSEAEVGALFSAAESDKERALLHLLYSCGLRRTEAIMLNLEDVHYRARMLYVRRGKGAKRRAIPITEKVSDALEAYTLEERRRPSFSKSRGYGSGYRGFVDPHAFLLNRVGSRMRGNTYEETLWSLKLRAGLETKTVTPHYLRHSIATHLLGAGVPIEQVRDFLGHSSLEATQIYAKVYASQLRNL